MVASILDHRAKYVDQSYQVDLFVQFAQRYSHHSGWKSELEMSWIAMDKVISYWNSRPGGRRGALDSVHPWAGAYLRCKPVLAVLGHRKTRYGCLEFKVVYQGVDLKQVDWVEKRMLRLGRDLDERTLADYCKVVGTAIPSDEFHVIANETTVEIRRCPSWVMRTS